MIFTYLNLILFRYLFNRYILVQGYEMRIDIITRYMYLKLTQIKHNTSPLS